MNTSDQLCLWVGRVLLSGALLFVLGWLLLDLLPDRIDKFFARRWLRWQVTVCAVIHAMRGCPCCTGDAEEKFRQRIEKLRKVG